MSASSYAEKLRDPRWQRKRLEVMNRDGFACRDCGATDKTLNVHHCHYVGDPWKANDSLLLTLCEDCHQSRGELEHDAKLALGYILQGLPNHPGEDDLKNFVDELVKASGGGEGFHPSVWNHDEVIDLANRAFKWDALQRKNTEEKAPS